ncbi:ParB/RepB/Spo0J family partition protein [Lutibacter sp. B2]|nr:ParB/RepB/Spo0J family partition protein [Lutibacter sp. B2]
MAIAKRGLGKGLNALIPQGKNKIYDKNENRGEINTINIHEIRPNQEQPRKKFDTEKIQMLAESIKTHGVIQPIVVRPVENGYEIIAGERRWKATQKAGLKEIPCIIKDIDERERMEIALIENLQREDLNSLEEAVAYKTLMDLYNLTQEQISSIVGKSRSHIANIIRLLHLSEDVKNMVISGDITGGHARALLRITDDKVQKEIADKIVQHELSVRETEKLIAGIVENKEVPKKKEKNKDHTLIDIEDTLKHILGTKVSIVKKKNKGKIEIEYYSDDDLERILEFLQKK